MVTNPTERFPEVARDWDTWIIALFSQSKVEMKGKRNKPHENWCDVSCEHNTGLTPCLVRAVYADIICFLFQERVSLRSLVGLVVQLDIKAFLKWETWIHEYMPSNSAAPWLANNTHCGPLWPGWRESLWRSFLINHISRLQVMMFEVFIS